MFSSYTGIHKRHDSLINIIPSQNIYGETIDQGDNLVQGMIGMMSCCNNFPVCLGVDHFL